MKKKQTPPGCVSWSPWNYFFFIGNIEILNSLINSFIHIQLKEKRRGEEIELCLPNIFGSVIALLVGGGVKGAVFKTEEINYQANLSSQKLNDW